ncbi:MAG: exodeoxyribonuclease VII small subunit [Solibacterales bacterium]|nr:exodeoxyribonuclease VII small subunit [Bryobacterales bacterium]
MQKKKEPSFEEGLDQLEKVVKKLEDGDLPLEKSLELFEQGVRLSDSCQKQLREAEHKVEILLNKNGKIETEPLHLDDSE